MSITLDSLKRDLADGAAATENASAADGKLREAGSDRLDEINRRLEELRPKVNGDSYAAAQYEALIAERGRLSVMLGGDA